MSTPRFIVAEVLRTWVDKEAAAGVDALISQRLEQVLALNLERGYRLHSWRFQSTQLAGGFQDQLVETVIAVFELEADADDHPSLPRPSVGGVPIP